MNKFKLLFLFVFALNIFSLSFCMQDGQEGNGQKRNRSQMETSEEGQSLKASKRKKEDETGLLVNIENKAGEQEQEDIVDNEFWDDLFGEKLETIRDTFLEIKKDPGFDADDNFYDAFKNFGDKDKHKKCVEVLKLFLDEDLDWLCLFNIFLYDKNLSALMLLKNKVINKINEFSRTDVFCEEKMEFLPGASDGGSAGYFRPLSPLFVAICLQDFNFVRLIVEIFGADVNAAQVKPENYDGPEIYTGMMPLEVAILLGDNIIIDYLIYNGAELNVETIKSLISSGKININFVDKLGRTLLHIACKSGNLDLAKYLISIGANLRAKDNLGNSPISLAIVCNFQELFSYLFELKSFDLKQEAGRFLFAAVSWNRIEMVKYFIEKLGVELNFVDENEDTFLHVACECSSYDVALYLAEKFIEKNIDINIVNKAGMTPLDIIIESKCYCPKLIYKLVMNGKKDINGKILIPDSLKNSKDYVFIMFCKILALFPSVYCDDKYLDSLYKDCEKPKNALSGLILLLNTYGELIGYYLEFATLVLDDLIMDCEKNSVKFCMLEDLNKIKNLSEVKDKNIPANIHGIFYILWNKQLKPAVIEKNKIKKLLSDFLKRIVDLLIENGSKIDEADYKNRLPIHLSCCGLDDVAIGDTPWDELYDGVTKYLIEKYKVNVNVRDINGCTPLWHAVNWGKRSSISALLDNGANLDNLDGKGSGFYELLQKSACAKAKNLYEYFENNRNIREKFERIKNNALERKEPVLNKIYPEDNCQICSSDFEAENLRRLFLVGCGHNFCEKCIKKRFIDSDGKLECVFCRKEQSDIEFDKK